MPPKKHVGIGLPTSDSDGTSSMSTEERLMLLLGQFEELTSINAELMVRMKKLEEEKMIAVAQTSHE